MRYKSEHMVKFEPSYDPSKWCWSILEVNAPFDQYLGNHLIRIHENLLEYVILCVESDGTLRFARLSNITFLLRIACGAFLHFFQKMIIFNVL